jgi:hypothetical protein
MPQAQIRINAAVPPQTIDKGTLVTVTNNNVGDETSYTYTLVSKPVGSAATLAGAGDTRTFTADLEGTYLVKLVVDSGLPSEDIDTQGCAVLWTPSGVREPAPGESTEYDGTDGWSEALQNLYLQVNTQTRGDRYVEMASTPSVAEEGSQFIGVLTSTIGAVSQVTLPEASTVGAGTRIHIQDMEGTAETNTITIARSGADTFNGSLTSILIDVNYGGVTMESDGNVWVVRSSTKLSVGNYKVKGQSYPTVTTLTDAASITPDANDGNVFYLLLTAAVGASRTLNVPSNMKPGTAYTFIIEQAGGGGLDVAFSANFKFAGGTPGAPIITAAGGAKDIVAGIADEAATDFLCNLSSNFS